MKIVVPFAALAAAAGAFAAPTAAPIAVQRPVIDFGDVITLSGTFPHGQTGQPVVVLSKEYGEAEYASLALLTTKTHGGWSTRVQPAIRTAYKATSAAEEVGPVAVDVRPRVTLARRGGGFVVRVVSTASYERHFVFFQRRARRGWKNLRKVVLSRRARRFDVRLPHGVSRVRAFLPRLEAGAGYVASASDPVRVRR